MLEENENATLFARARLYAGLGLFVGILVFGIAVIIVPLRSGGATLALAEWAVTFAYYVAAGILGGAFYGALLPLKKKRGGTPLIVFVVSFIVYSMGVPIAVRLDPSVGEFGLGDIVLGALLAAVTMTGMFVLFRRNDGG